jgi:hypothetical protein
MTIELVQTLKFHATRKTRTSWNVVGSISYNKHLDPRTCEQWNNFFTVPAVCPSSNGLCRIIDISYNLVFKFDAKGFSTSKSLSIPVTIGNFFLNCITYYRYYFFKFLLF